MARLTAAVPLLIVLIAAAAVFGSIVPNANAGTVYEVDTTADDPSKSACTIAANDCSLRGAIDASNASPGIIELQLGATYNLTVVGLGEDANEMGDLDILDGTTIDGNFATVDANGLDRVFHIDPGSSDSVFIDDLTITGGLLGLNDGFGGGINLESGTLTLDNVTVTENVTQRNGGGIAVSGNASIEIDGSDISENLVDTSVLVGDQTGGGLFKADGTGGVLITNSLFTLNEALDGGGMYIGVSSVASLMNTDVTSNTAVGVCGAGCFGPGGGGISSGAQTVTISGGNISNNKAPDSSGGGLKVAGLVMTGTVLQENISLDEGGAILADTATITGALIQNNEAAFGAGFHVFNGTITNTYLFSNDATENGGGGYIAGNATIDSSTFYLNTAVHEGGGLAVGTQSPTVVNSTISGNTAGRGGGIARNSITASAGEIVIAGDGPGIMTVEHTTIAFNESTVGGANLDVVAPPALTNVEATIFANPIGAPNCGVFHPASLGYNVEDSDTCGLDDLTDRVNADPALQPLVDNGGSTPTHALGANSDALDAAFASCPPPFDDQRGEPRPQGLYCDSGAFESSIGTTPTPSPTATGGASPTATPTEAPSPTATPAESATPTASPTTIPSEQIWGDVNCDGAADIDDALLVLAWFAFEGDVETPANCYEIGDTVSVDGTPRLWGDVLCGGAVGLDDALTVALYDSGILTAPPTGCPVVGTSVDIT